MKGPRKTKLQMWQFRIKRRFRNFEEGRELGKKRRGMIRASECVFVKQTGTGDVRRLTLLWRGLKERDKRESYSRKKSGMPEEQALNYDDTTLLGQCGLQ